MECRLTRSKDVSVDETETRLFPSAWPCCMTHLPGSAKAFYLEKARIILAEIWRKNIDAMKESERTRTIKGSLWKMVVIVGISNDEKGAGGHIHSKTR